MDDTSSNINQKYETWQEFKEALKKQIKENLSDNFWTVLREILFLRTIHAPFDKVDIDDSIHIIKKLQAIVERKNE